MSGAAQNGAYGHPGTGQGPWGAGWGSPPQGAPQGNPWGFWNPWTLPKPFLIFGTIIGFMLWWPIGLALLFFMIGRRSLACAWRSRPQWQQNPYQQNQAGPWRGWCREEQPSSGNRAFDEYRADTLRRLEEEQREFGAFLDRLRVAKDKAEFDQFMAERRRPPQAPPQDQPSAG